MRQELARSRDRLTAGLESIGFPVLRSQGTYFLTVDLSPLGLNETDEAFCKRIVTDYKVAAIPVSAFYERDAVTSVVRFCFAKRMQPSTPRWNACRTRCTAEEADDDAWLDPN
jgi:aspartate/methionine/tyrosine aminotransferase